MLAINLGNIEELIFYDQEVQKRLPELVDLFQQWKLGKQVPTLRSISRRAVIDTLNRLEENLPILEKYFGQVIVVDKLDYHVIKDGTLSILDAENKLCEYEGFQDVCISRKGEQLYVLFWR